MEELADERGFAGEKGGSGAFSLRGTSFDVVGAQIGLAGNLDPEPPRDGGGANFPCPPIIVGRRRRSLSRGGGERGEPGAGGPEEVDVKAGTRRVGDESKEWGPLVCFMRERTVGRYLGRRRRRRRKRRVERKARKARKERTPIAAFTPGERPFVVEEVASWESVEGASW